MNFFGHAIVASKVPNANGAIVLGAMLPDFCAMIRARTTSLELEGVQQGVELHHETDSAFHGAAEFVEMCAQTTALLEARGVMRGASRAVGHIGIELLLDGTLFPNDDGVRLYLEALRIASQDSFATFEAAEHAAHMRLVASRIATYGSPETHSDPDSITNRLVRVLSDRPRLRLDEHGAEMTREVLRVMEPIVCARGPKLMSTVLRGVHLA